MDLIQLSGLTKRYGRAKVAAVKDVSLTVKAGEAYGFLGSNGAGKSTTIRTMLDFLRPTSGSITILGKDSVRDGVEVRRKVGYLPGDVTLPKRITGRQYLDYLAKISGGVDPTYRKDLESRFEAQLDKKMWTLSKGNRQKIGIIQACMHQPEVLILDEPTSGLDPLMREQFFRTIQEAKLRGAAVFLSSHDLAEVERICDRVGIIRKGELIHEGKLADVMKARIPQWRVTLKKKADRTALEKSPRLHVVESDELTLLVEPKKDIREGLIALSSVDIVSMSMDERDLDEQFMSYYEGGV